MSKEEFQSEDDYRDYLEDKYNRFCKEIDGFGPPHIWVIYEFEDILKDTFLTRSGTGTLYWLEKNGAQTYYRIHWRNFYEYAFKHSGNDLEKIISDYRKQHFNKVVDESAGCFPLKRR